MSKMESLKRGRMKYITIITSCGVLQTLLMFLQAHTATGAVIVVPQSMPYVLQPSMGMRSTAVGSAAMPMGMGSMGTNTMGQQLAGVMIPTGGNVAQNPPPVVLTDGSGQKVVGSANPLTGVIAVDANKLKEGLGAATAEDPPAPPPAE